MNGSGITLPSILAVVPLWISAASLPSASGAERDPLFGEAAPADHAVDALARQHEPNRPADELGGGRGEHLMLPQALAAEAAADERRGDDHLLLVQPEHLRDRPGGVRDELRGVVNSQRVALPRDGDAVELDRIMVVTRGRIGRVDAGRGAQPAPLRHRLSRCAAGRP